MSKFVIFNFFLALLVFITGCSDDVVSDEKSWDLTEHEVQVVPDYGETPPYRDGGETLGTFKLQSNRDFLLTGVSLRVYNTENISFGGFTLRYADVNYGLVTFNSNQVGGEFTMSFETNPIEVSSNQDVLFSVLAGLEVISYDYMTYMGTELNVYITGLNIQFYGKQQELDFEEEILLSSYLEE